MPVSHLQDSCWAAAGLWVHAFDATVASALLADFDWVVPTRKRPLALLLANGAELWSRFLRAYRSSNTLKAAAHPLDAWVEESVTQVFAAIEACRQIYFTHRRYEGRFLPMVSIAQACGFAATAPCHLAVRQDVGPWLALRALVLLDADAPAATAPVLEPCSSCAAPCRPLFEHALMLTQPQSDDAVIDVAPQWQHWVAARDACPYGRSARYSSDQIEYHYTRRRGILE